MINRRRRVARLSPRACARITTLLAIASALLATAASSASAHPPNLTPPFANGHPYRHGVVPMRGQAGLQALSVNDLNYGGGISGVGVTTGAPRVYLIFWGSQWGSQSSNSSGNVVLSGDPNGMAPDLQAFFKGLGTGSELWSGVMTQYCDGVSVGAQTCPSSAAHVGYPTGGALAGVWVDESVPAPSAASAHAIGAEAVSAATHFGNTTQTSNRNTQYVIVSPTATNPDSYKTQGFCAWHDYTGDGTLDGGGAVSSPDGLLAFTNMPYVTDVGASCGQNFVNSGSAGTLDGVTIVEGHEYAETVTDQFPAGGWTDNSGAETGDKCAWISSGQGKSQDITLTTGTFAVQSTWANDYNSGSGGCEVSHPIVSNSTANTVSVTSPGNQSSTVGTPVNLQIQASDSGGATLTYSATGLPAGLSINSSTGLISGTPSTATTSSVTVTASDSTGASGNASFSWTVSGTTANTVTVTNPGNQSSTVGTPVSLQIHASDSGGATLTYSATGLPAGLSISSSSGLISGTPSSASTYSVVVSANDSTGAAGSASFTWTVSAPSSGCTAAQLLGNPGFETGSAAPWSATAGVIQSSAAGEPAHSGNYLAWLDGYGSSHTDTLGQTVSIPSGCSSYAFSFWLHIDTAKTGTTASDTLKVQVLNSSGTVLGTLATYSNLNAASGYQQHSFNLAAYAGQKVTLKFTGVQQGRRETSFVVDDTALNVS